MKKNSGLICAGGVTQSFLARMPSVLATVGPVYSVSLRVARRMANSLRAGYAIDDPSEFAACNSIWIAMPESAVDEIVEQVRGGLKDKIVVLCDSTRPANFIGVDSARAATLNAVDPNERVLTAEGHPDAVAVLRKIAARESRKLIELRRDSKALLVAGLQLASDLVLPPYAAAVESFRAAGFPRADAIRLAESLSDRALKSFSKAGRKAWSPAAAKALQRTLKDELESIRSAHPAIAEEFASAALQALRYF